MRIISDDTDKKSGLTVKGEDGSRHRVQGVRRYGKCEMPKIKITRFPKYTVSVERGLKNDTSLNFELMPKMNINRVIYAEGRNVYMDTLRDGKIHSTQPFSEKAADVIGLGESVKIIKNGMTRVQAARVVKTLTSKASTKMR